MLSKRYLILVLLVTTSVSGLKIRPKQSLRYRENDIFLNTCPAYSAIDYTAALFPDPVVIPDLSKTTVKDKTQTANAENTVLNNDALNAIDSKKNVLAEEDKPLASFEEWQKKVMQETEKDRRHKRKTAEGGGIQVKSNKRQQVIDSIDGGFSDDFGSMFEDLIGGVIGKEKKPNVYAEKEYIAPSKQGEGNSNKKTQQFAAARMKSLKERFNYASTDCAATVRKANKQAKGAQSILYESKDQYLLNKCAADKFVIINLCEQIVVDTIVMANFEFFSSTFKDFRVYGSLKYPTDDWRLLGQWQARNTRDLQVFKVPIYGFNEYLKIEFLSHYGHEYYCPLSLVRVHGMPMMEYWRDVESQDEPVTEEEHLWPAEVREQIIQPQFEVANTSESFPIKTDVDEEELKPIIPPINLEPADLEMPSIPDNDNIDIDTKATFEATEELLIEKENTGGESETEKKEEVVKAVEEYTHTTLNVSSTEFVSERTTPVSTIISSTSASSTEAVLSSLDNSSEEDKSSAHTEVTSKKSTMPSTSTSQSSETDVSSSAPSTENVNSTSTVSTDATNSASEDSRPIIPPPPQKAVAPNYIKQGSAQESIYKTIMKRLSVLEGNMTMSLRYLDEQNKNLNNVLKEMEKKHQEQLINLIGHLNETASHSIDSMKRRYEQWYEDLKDQTDSDMREMTARISILADQLSFERRVSVSQLVIMITLFVFMALSRGTFSTLSPVMAAQQVERKRRESIDHSSIVSNTPAENSNTSKSSSTAHEDIKPTNTTVQKTNETLKKPSNPRRHTDNIYHFMNDVDSRASPTSRSRGLSDAATAKEGSQSQHAGCEKHGIDPQNEVLQKKLGDIYLQQQEEQQVPLLSKSEAKESSHDGPTDATPVKNRKRSSTSPSALDFT